MKTIIKINDKVGERNLTFTDGFSIMKHDEQTVDIDIVSDTSYNSFKNGIYLKSVNGRNIKRIRVTDTIPEAEYDLMSVWSGINSILSDNDLPVIKFDDNTIIVDELLIYGDYIYFVVYDDNDNFFLNESEMESPLIKETDKTIEDFIKEITKKYFRRYATIGNIEFIQEG